MTFKEAESMLKRIKDVLIGTKVKDMTIDTFFIGPTDWNLMTEYLNKQIKYGAGATIEAFSGRSLEVIKEMRVSEKGILFVFYFLSLFCD